FALALVLSFTPKTAMRYFLPVSVIVSYLAALGIIDLAGLIATRFKLEKWQPIFVAIGLVATVLSFVPSLRELDRALASDHRRELAEFISAHVPKFVGIAQDSRVDLAGSNNPDRDIVITRVKQPVY